MLTPPKKLAEILALVLSTPGREAELISVRERGRLEEWIALTQALAMAKQGLIEGIGSRTRPLRYVRRVKQKSEHPRTVHDPLKGATTTAMMSIPAEIRAVFAPFDTRSAHH